MAVVFGGTALQAGSGVPEADHHVVADRGEDVAIGRWGDVPNPAGVAVEGFGEN